MSAQTFLLERSGETDAERRLRENLEVHASKIMHTLDSSINLRSAAAEAQRCRHQARADLQSALLRAMHAHGLATSLPQKTSKAS